jgi:hypothetical protein
MSAKSGADGFGNNWRKYMHARLGWLEDGDAEQISQLVDGFHEVRVNIDAPGR